MAKKKTTQKTTETVSNNLLPISIFVAAIMISATLLMTQDKDANNQVAENIDGSEEIAGTGDEGFAEVTASIDDDPYLGDRDSAKVAIIEFSEYQCSYCKRHTDETIPSLKENFVDTGDAIYVFRDFQMYGELSESLSKIAECVNDVAGIDKYEEFHSLAFNATTTDDAYGYLSDLSVDQSKVESCVSDSNNDELTSDMEDGQALGIQGTPAFVVGKLDDDGNVEGVLIPGAYPYAEFEKVIQEYL